MLPSLKLKKLQITPVPPELEVVLATMQDVFPPKLPLILPVQHETDHRIDLIEGSKPPAHRINRMLPMEETALKKQLDDYLASGQIVKTNSPFGAGVLFAPKKDGTLRLCIDYRQLNKLSVKDIYPLPRIEEILDSLANAKYYTKLDLQQGYHQIRMHPEHAKRTAFQTKFGSYHFLVMPFGLANAQQLSNARWIIYLANSAHFVMLISMTLSFIATPFRNI